MLRWLSCHLFRAHEYAVRCDTGGVFLECEDCGYRSAGWHTGPVDPLAPDVDEPVQLHTPFDRLRSLIAGLGVIDVLRRV